MERPDLKKADPEIIAYIQFLEAELARLTKKFIPAGDLPESLPVEPEEPPTTINLVTLSEAGVGKRTPRHLYTRQRRGGMGVFDLDTQADDPPRVLAVADESQCVLLFTNHARAFRLPLSKLSPSPVRSRGESITGMFPLETDERIIAILPEQASGYIALVSQRGMVRCLRHHLFGEYLRPGTSFFNVREFGPLAAASWTPGDADLFIATRSGTAIRFPEKLVPPAGVLGIRLAADDIPVAVTGVYPDSSVFLAGEDGHGTIRLMSGFNPNKSAGGGGKTAMRTNKLIAAMQINPDDDILIISRLGKIIRFKASEVAATEGVVQGVICMSLRGDECVAAAKSKP